MAIGPRADGSRVTAVKPISTTAQNRARTAALRSKNRNAGKISGATNFRAAAAPAGGKGGKGNKGNKNAAAAAAAVEPRIPNLDPNRALNDPVYQYYMNEALGGFRAQTAQERERLSNLYTNIYGETGQLKGFDTQSEQDRRRLAAEMAMRGTLQSGAYAGGERGLGTLQQKEQAAQRAGIEKGYNDQTSPQALFDMGLTRGADGKVTELVQGQDVSWKDPSTGETKTMKYDWTQTTAGRAAKQAALQQWVQKQLAGVTSVM